MKYSDILPTRLPPMKRRLELLVECAVVRCYMDGAAPPTARDLVEILLATEVVFTMPRRTRASLRKAILEVARKRKILPRATPRGVVYEHAKVVRS